MESLRDTDMKKTIYKSVESERLMMALYDEQLLSLGIEFEDIYVDTRFGITHLIRTGNPDGKPVILFHGGNSTAPYYLRDFLFLRDQYLIYAPDTMGHPGKSAHTVLSARNVEYGEWASDVIDGLGLQQVICIGGSYGGGILTKLMCVAPDKISKAILLVPSGICNVSILSILIRLGIPMTLYILTRNETLLKKAILPMAVYENEIDEDTLTMVRSTFNNVRVKAGMPSNVKAGDIAGYKSPTLLIAGSKDILFPGKRVIARAKKLIPNIKTYLMSDSGHMSRLTSDKNSNVIGMMEKFLRS
jgi:pimeloyl-ACP methyl ester carboxylesterase